VVIDYALAHGITLASRHFGLDRETVRRWRDAYRQAGVAGLVPHYPAHRASRLAPEVLALIRQARLELRYGAPRAQLWLARVHQVRVSTSVLQQAFRGLGIPRLTRLRKRRPRQLHLFETPTPGDSVQVDVKLVTIAGRMAYHDPALDDCPRYRVLRLYPRKDHHASLDFLAHVRRRLPFAIRQLHTDSGSEFPLAFALTVQAAGIHHRYIRPRRPQLNGKVERSIRIDQEEFWSRAPFPDFAAAVTALQPWERTYNYERFSLALHGLTPLEKLAAKSPCLPLVSAPPPLGQVPASEPIPTGGPF
jgi:transposase InsO family protein